MQAPSIKGIIAPTFLPVDDNGECDLGKIPAYLDELCRIGVSALFVNGTTGEFFNMTLDERKKVAAAWVEEANKRKMPVIIQVGASNLRDSQELARHAATLKPAAIAVVVATFVQPQTVETLVEYVKSVAETTPDMAVYYYHIPLFTHCKVNVVEFMEFAGKDIPNLVGLKYTDSNLDEIKGCLDASDGKFKVYPGSEDIYCNALDLGCDTFIFGSASYANPLFTRIAKSHAGGDKEALARDSTNMKALHKIYADNSQHAITSCLKNVARLCGLEVGPVRLPLKSAEGLTLLTLREDLESLNFFQWRN